MSEKLVKSRVVEANIANSISGMTKNIFKFRIWRRKLIVTKFYYPKFVIVILLKLKVVAAGKVKLKVFLTMESRNLGLAGTFENFQPNVSNKLIKIVGRGRPSFISI